MTEAVRHIHLGGGNPVLEGAVSRFEREGMFDKAFTAGVRLTSDYKDPTRSTETFTVSHPITVEDDEGTSSLSVRLGATHDSGCLLDARQFMVFQDAADGTVIMLLDRQYPGDSSSLLPAEDIRKITTTLNYLQGQFALQHHKTVAPAE